MNTFEVYSVCRLAKASPTSVLVSSIIHAAHVSIPSGVGKIFLARKKSILSSARVACRCELVIINDETLTRDKGKKAPRKAFTPLVGRVRFGEKPSVQPRTFVGVFFVYISYVGYGEESIIRGRS